MPESQAQAGHLYLGMERQSLGAAGRGTGSLWTGDLWLSPLSHMGPLAQNGSSQQMLDVVASLHLKSMTRFVGANDNRTKRLQNLALHLKLNQWNYQQVFVFIARRAATYSNIRPSVKPLLKHLKRCLVSCTYSTRAAKSCNSMLPQCYWLSRWAHMQSITKPLPTLPSTFRIL